MKKITFFLFIITISLSGLSQNNSLNLDGQDDFVDLGDNFGFAATDAFSVEAWIKFGTSRLQQIISKLGPGGAGDFRGWGFQIENNGYLSGYITDQFFSDRLFVEGVTVLSDSNWHHVAMTFDGNNTILLYIDGAPETLTVSNLGTVVDISTTSNAHIGNYEGAGFPAEYFEGNIDDLRIWDVVKSPSEIADSMMTELTGNEANLIGYYKMDVDNSSCDIEDCNTNETHGIRNGSSGPNDLPQFSEDTPPNLTDVACGAVTICTLSVTDIEAVKLKIFPNPSNNIINFSGMEMNETDVAIINMLGQVINSEKIRNNQIDISLLPSGVYFVSFDYNSTQISKKIVKR